MALLSTRTDATSPDAELQGRLFSHAARGYASYLVHSAADVRERDASDRPHPAYYVDGFGEEFGTAGHMRRAVPASPNPAVGASYDVPQVFSGWIDRYIVIGEAHREWTFFKDRGDVHFVASGTEGLGRVLVESFAEQNAVANERARNQLYSSLVDLRDAVSSPDWDGEGAPALDETVFEYAKRFVGLLPFDRIGQPEIDATPHGEIVFSWDSTNVVDSFDILVFSSDRLALAGLFDGVQLSGEMGFDDKSIGRIADLVRWTDQQ